MLCQNRESLLFYPILHHGAVPQAKEGDDLELNREQYREPEDTVATTTRDEDTKLLPFFYHNRAAAFICLAFNPFDRMPDRFVEPIGELPAPYLVVPSCAGLGAEVMHRGWEIDP
jgi:hypothetical protein